MAYERKVEKLINRLVTDCDESRLGKGFAITALCSALVIAIETPDEELPIKQSFDAAMALLFGMHACTGEKGTSKVITHIKFAKMM